jgi:hypothetical protein
MRTPGTSGAAPQPLPGASSVPPERVEALVRTLIGDDRALTAVDSEGRAAYAERVAKQIVDALSGD